MNSILTYSSAIIVLSFVVTTHELGHYIVARLFGIKVDEFSVGFWKPIFQFKSKSGTIWKFCTIPFGGYVKMHGDEDVTSLSSGKESQKITTKEKKCSFFCQPNYVKIIVSLAGPFINYVTGFLIMVAVLYIRGVQFGEPKIVDFATNSPAKVAGLKSGDTILKADKHTINNISDLRELIILKNGAAIDITISRPSSKEEREMLTFNVQPIETSQKNAPYSIGIFTVPTKAQPVNLRQAIVVSSVEIYETTKGAVLSIVEIFSKKPKKTLEIGGPISMAKMSAKATEQGMAAFFLFVAAISIGIGFINLLPIPIVDGGQALIYLAEMLIGKKFSPKVYSVLQIIGISTVALLMGLATFNDIKAIFFR